MKLSLNWIRDINKRYACSAEPAPDGIDKLVEKIGAQLGAVDEVVDLGKRYEGIVVVKVVSVEKHPNADKLTVCMIDDGKVVKGVKRDKNGLVQIVCGAPNVKPTLAVAWIPPGVAVPATYDKEPFVLEAREIRGVISNGMLASPKELALGDSHEGLLIIDETVKPGTPFAKAYGLDDHIIDIENKMFTHRPDLFGMLGIFREIAGIQGHVFKSPAWYRQDAKLAKGNSRDTHPLRVENKVPKLVPRFIMVVLKDIKVESSPAWLQARLSSVGLRPINNIVDLTNYLMLETGQPLHAYDYDKVRAQDAGSSRATIRVRLSEPGEKLRLLGGKEIKLEEGAIVIATATRAVGIGGVMGGTDTEVDENTKVIILECGSFDMNTTRRSAMAHGLFTDAATRFTKGQSPLQNIAVTAKAVEDIMRIAGGRVTSAHDDNHVPSEAVKRGNIHPPVKLTAGFINLRLGLQLTAAQIDKLLSNVEFKVSRNGDRLEASAPFWRTDISIAEDIVEEVGRLHGYDRLPVVLPVRSLTPADSDPILDIKQRIRSILVGAGANETLTYSFVHEDLLKKAGQDPADAYHIRNAISPDLQYYRLSVIPSLLDKIHANIRSGFDKFAVFEIGKGHFKEKVDEEGLPMEMERVALVFANRNSQAGAPFFQAKRLADHLMQELGIRSAEYVTVDPKKQSKTATYYEPSRTAEITIDGRKAGRVGEFKESVRAAFKLPKYCAGFALDIEKLRAAESDISYQQLNRFPELEQDICLRTSAAISYGELTSFADEFLKSASEKHGYGYELEPLDIFQRDGDSDHKQTTWRIKLWHPQRTLTTEESNRMLDELAEKAKTRLKAERV